MLLTDIRGIQKDGTDNKRLLTTSTPRFKS